MDLTQSIEQVLSDISTMLDEVMIAQKKQPTKERLTLQPIQRSKQ